MIFFSPFVANNTKIDLKNHVFTEALEMHSEVNDPQSRISCFNVTLLYIEIGFSELVFR